MNRDMVFVGSYAWSTIDDSVKWSDIDVWKEDNLKLSLPTIKLDLKTIPHSILNLFSGTYPTLDELYTIKCSHLGYDNVMWAKHKSHILKMKSKGATLVPKLYQALLKHWKLELGNKEFLNLDKSKEEFFTDHVNYRFNHDYLHTVVASPHKPIYEAYVKTGSDVLLCRDKLSSVPTEHLILMFKEEINTICLERWLLNEYWLKTDLNIAKAHSLALKKTITNLTKGWATNFIVENLDSFVKPDYDVYLRVINELLTSKEKGKYMQDESVGCYLESIYENYCDFHNEGIEGFVYNCCEGTICKDDLKDVVYKHIQREGGGEDGSEACYGVFSLDGRIFKAEYSYYSYDGDDYSDILRTVREVKPVERTVTFYE